MPLGEPHKPVEHKLTADEAGMRPRVVVIPGSRLDMSAHPTDFKWSEADHPRDAGGRFGDGGEGDKKPNTAPIHMLVENSEGVIEGYGTLEERKKDIHSQLKKISTKDISGSRLNTTAKRLAEAGFHPEIIKRSGLKEIISANLESGTAGTYNNDNNIIQLGKGADANTLIHEIGHTLDYKFMHQSKYAWGMRNDNLKDKLGIAAHVEYKTASAAAKIRARLRKDLGTNDLYRNLKANNVRVTDIAPSHYALFSSKEWIAESFVMYAGNEKTRDKLKKITPKTFAFIKATVEGEPLRRRI